MHPARHLFQPAANQRLGQSFDGAELVGIHSAVPPEVLGNSHLSAGLPLIGGSASDFGAAVIDVEPIGAPIAVEAVLNNPNSPDNFLHGSSLPNDSGHVAAQVVVSVPAGYDDQAKLRQRDEWHAGVFAQDVHGVDDSAQGCVGVRHARSFASRCAGDAVRGFGASLRRDKAGHKRGQSSGRKSHRITSPLVAFSMAGARAAGVGRRALASCQMNVYEAPVAFASSVSRPLPV